MKKSIYFNEYNLLMGSGGIVYLPFVSGILSACLRASDIPKSRYKVKPFIFVPNTVDEIIAQYDEEPCIVAFSISMWNEQLSLEVAKRVKERWKDCLVIFGGSQCPHNPVDYMKQNSFIDVCVRAEGEEAFVKIVSNHLRKKGFDNIPNCSYRNHDEIIVNKEVPVYDRSLDSFPSPYLNGEFEYLLADENHNYQAIIETNRGCPFLCTFCYWGKGGSATKYRFRDLDTVFKEIEYLGSKKVSYIFNADSNFGMHRRDYDIALKLVEAKKKFGFPEKFRTCWGKNTSERIFKIASILQYHGLDKGVTLARQSNSLEVLKNIKRENIKLDAYSVLEKSFNKLQVPVYGELILGLPGETPSSWKSGINQMLESGLNNQLFVYQAEVYPNTELGSETYQNKHKIVTRRIQLNEVHCSPRPDGWVKEYQDIVIENYSMTEKDWQSMTVFSVFTMLLHSMKAGIFILNFLRRECAIPYSEIIDQLVLSRDPVLLMLVRSIKKYTRQLLGGMGRGLISKKYSDVYLEIEEVLLLKVCELRSRFYESIYNEFYSALPKGKREAFKELIDFQLCSLPKYGKEEYCLKFESDYNIPEYCATIFSEHPKPLKRKQSQCFFAVPAYESLHDFTRRQVIWARKSGTILYASDVEVAFKEKQKIAYSLDNFSDEKEFKISLFDYKDRQKFEKFTAYSDSEVSRT